MTRQIRPLENIAPCFSRKTILLCSSLSRIFISSRRSLRYSLLIVSWVEDSINSDLPFNLAERKARIDNVKAKLADPDVSPAEQYRLVLNAYKIEVSYGQGIDSYEGVHPTKPGNVVNFIRFGRTSLVYVTKDETEVARYNLENQSWDVLSGADALAMRQAIRIAKGEAAPDIVYAPVTVSN